MACAIRPGINSNIRGTLRVFAVVCTNLLKTLSVPKSTEKTHLVSATRERTDKQKKFENGVDPETGPDMRAYATISSCLTFLSCSVPNFILTLRFFAISTHLPVFWS